MVVGAGLSCLWSLQPTALGGAPLTPGSPRPAHPGLPDGCLCVYMCMYSLIFSVMSKASQASQHDAGLREAPSLPSASSTGPDSAPVTGLGVTACGPSPTSAPPSVFIPGSDFSGGLGSTEAPPDATGVPAAACSSPSAGMSFLLPLLSSHSRVVVPIFPLCLSQVHQDRQSLL